VNEVWGGTDEKKRAQEDAIKDGQERGKAGFPQKKRVNIKKRTVGTMAESKKRLQRTKHPHLTEVERLGGGTLHQMVWDP